VPNDVNRPVKDVNTNAQHPNAPAVDNETNGSPYVTSLHDTPYISFAYLCHMTQLSEFFDSHKYRGHTFSLSGIYTNLRYRRPTQATSPSIKSDTC
jgi:hypothetical protein